MPLCAQVRLLTKQGGESRGVAFVQFPDAASMHRGLALHRSYFCFAQDRDGEKDGPRDGEKGGEKTPQAAKPEDARAAGEGIEGEGADGEGADGGGGEEFWGAGSGFDRHGRRRWQINVEKSAGGGRDSKRKRIDEIRQVIKKTFLWGSIEQLSSF